MFILSDADPEIAVARQALIRIRLRRSSFSNCAKQRSSDAKPDQLRPDAPCTLDREPLRFAPAAAVNAYENLRLREGVQDFCNVLQLNTGRGGKSWLPGIERNVVKIEYGLFAGPVLQERQQLFFGLGSRRARRDLARRIYLPALRVRK